MDIFLIIGIIGMICILYGFLMVQRHHWTQDDFIYDFLNAIGSLLLVISAVASHAWPFVVLNTIWGGYSFRDVLFKDKWKLPNHKKIQRRVG